MYMLYLEHSPPFLRNFKMYLNSKLAIGSAFCRLSHTKASSCKSKWGWGPSCSSLKELCPWTTGFTVICSDYLTLIFNLNCK